MVTILFDIVSNNIANLVKLKKTYVFSWPVLWLAFGDNPILFVPMLPAPS